MKLIVWIYFLEFCTFPDEETTKKIVTLEFYVVLGAKSKNLPNTI